MKNTPFTPDQFDQLIRQIEEIMDPVLSAHGEDDMIQPVYNGRKKRISDSKALSTLAFLYEVAQLHSEKRKLGLAASLSYANDEVFLRLVHHASDVRELMEKMNQKVGHDPELQTLFRSLKNDEKWLSNGLQEEAYDRIHLYRSDISLLTENSDNQ